MKPDLFPPACLLVTHGSRDPRPQIAIDHLVQLMSQSSDRLIGAAQLELAATPLHQQMIDFAQQVSDRGNTRLQILPLFLLAGVHVMEDIPAEVEIARSKLPDLAIELLPFAGQHRDFWKLTINPIDEIGTSAQKAKILLAHGSRRQTANAPILQIAAQINAVPAFWSVDPKLETQVTNQIRQGCREIQISPYFLFEGGITDAIAQQVQQFAQQYPYVKFDLTQTIGASRALADFLLALL